MNDDDLDSGTAGGSARREHDRRRAAREQRVLAKHPRIGRAALALGGQPGHERAWARGAEGEETVARSLQKRCGDEVVLLHDRRIPGSRANIDHLAIAPSGVWVIDTKRYSGKVAVSRPLLGKAKLTIAGRDRSTLADGLTGQVELVAHAVAEITPGVSVHGALCFVDADLPLLGTLTFRDLPLLYPRALAKRLNAAGPVTAEQRAALAPGLADRFGAK